MLALARKVNESIILNDNIEVTVLEVKGDQVKIGINAPKDVPIYRKELFVQIQDDVHHLKLLDQGHGCVLFVERVLLQEAQTDHLGDLQHQLLVIGEHI